MTEMSQVHRLNERQAEQVAGKGRRKKRGAPSALVLEAVEFISRETSFEDGTCAFA